MPKLGYNRRRAPQLRTYLGDTRYGGRGPAWSVIYDFRKKRSTTSGENGSEFSFMEFGADAKGSYEVFEHKHKPKRFEILQIK